MIPHVFRLNPGQDLYLELQKYIQTHKIEAATVLSLIGSLSQLSVRMAAAKQESLYKDDFEILQVSGTLSQQGLHLHGSFSKKDGTLIGGHIKPGCLIRTTAEVILVQFKEWNFNRVIDQSIGYPELVAKKKS